MGNQSIETKPRIIVIDDNPATHEDFKKIVASENEQQELPGAEFAFPDHQNDVGTSAKRLDVELDSAYQGTQGYAMVRAAVEQNRPYTLAFCDMRMPPGEDGLMTIEELIKVDPNLQVVICSDHSDDTWTRISERFGQSGRLLILRKPFDSAEVLQTIVSLIDKRRHMDAALLKQEHLEELVAERTLHLKESRKEAEQLLSAIESILLKVDEQGVVRRWNHCATETFQLPPESTVGLAFDSIPVQWDDPESVARLFKQPQGREAQQIELKFTDSQQMIRIVGFSTYPIFDEQVFQGSLVLGKDLTEKRTLEQQLNNAQKLESVGQLAAGVAHEINTPMQYLGDNLEYVSSKFEGLFEFLFASTSLLDSLETSDVHLEEIEKLRTMASGLKLKKLHAQIPGALSDSIDGVKHVSRIVKAMKELSHPGGEDKAPVDINRILETTITVSTNEWKYVAEIETEFGQDLDIIDGYSGELSQVFLNLIVNAAHAISDKTDEGKLGRGKIKVASYRHDHFVRVSISDTGGGIPETIRNKVFDPFFTTKKVGKGTGQGLAIAHSVVVQKHGGQLSFEVEEGLGTLFHIDLPMTTTQTRSDETLTI